jgi:hypothetical protein
VSSWQISSAREQTYQFSFFDKRKKKKREKEKRGKFEMPSVLD